MSHTRTSRFIQGIVLSAFIASSVFFTTPRQARAVILIPILIAAVVVDAVSCNVNVIWGCDGGGGGGGTPAPVACKSSGNICGMKNDGTIVSGSCNANRPPDSDCPSCTSPKNACGMSNSGYIVNGSCNVTAPLDSACPPPVIITDGNGGGGTNPNFISTPRIVGKGGSSTIAWDIPNATACTLTGNGVNVVAGPKGSASSGILNSTKVFTLTCENGGGATSPRVSADIKVIVLEFQEF